MSYRTKWGAEWMQTVKNAAVRLLNTLDDKIIIIKNWMRRIIITKTKRIYTTYNGKVLLSPYDVMDGVFKFLIRKPNS